MTHILLLLQEMRGRLAVYVGDQSLTKLAAFLRGYDCAVLKLGQGNPDPFLPKFRDWVHQRYGSKNLSWEAAILAQCSNEADAVQRFWKLLDAYLEQNGQMQVENRPAPAVSSVATGHE